MRFSLSKALEGANGNPTALWRWYYWPDQLESMRESRLIDEWIEEQTDHLHALVVKKYPGLDKSGQFDPTHYTAALNGNLESRQNPAPFLELDFDHMNNFMKRLNRELNLPDPSQENSNRILQGS